MKAEATSSKMIDVPKTEEKSEKPAKKPETPAKKPEKPAEKDVWFYINNYRKQAGPVTKSKLRLLFLNAEVQK